MDIIKYIADRKRSAIIFINLISINKTKNCELTQNFVI